jgi:hydrogenase-4 component F
MISLLCAFLPLIGILPTFGKKSVRRSLLALVVVSTLSFLISAFILVEGSIDGVLRFGESYFVSDPSSRLFIALISAVFTGMGLYVYHRGLTNPFALRKIQNFVRSTFLFFAISVLAILSNHFILMWLFLEASALSVIPLIYHQKGLPSIRAAWKYFLFSVVGLGLVSLGFIFLARSALSQAEHGEAISFFFQDRGSYNWLLALQPWRDLGLALIFFGFGTKLGLAPMYTWLPETYDLSPPSVTVLLSAIQFNAVMLAVFRVFQYLEPLQSPIIRYELIAMGLISIIASALYIVVAKNYKRLIAYASINHAGVIAVGLGIGKTAAYGVLLYVISNALVKAVLFLTCGNIKARYRTKSIHELQGLIKSMPFSGWFFMIGIFALLGFAPFGSFFGELLIMKSMIEGRHFAVFAVFCLLMTVVFVATGRATFPMIWGEPKHEVSHSSESIYMLLPKLFYVFLLLSLGIYIPSQANLLLEGIASGIGGR